MKSKPKYDDPYQDGWYAFLRDGLYEGVTGDINCPYDDGTEESEKWTEGYEDAISAYERLV